MTEEMWWKNAQDLGRRLKRIEDMLPDFAAAEVAMRDRADRRAMQHLHYRLVDILFGREDFVQAGDMQDAENGGAGPVQDDPVAVGVEPQEEAQAGRGEELDAGEVDRDVLWGREEQRGEESG
jgi:hypothetical protein